MTTLRPPPLVLLIGADGSDGLPLSRLKESGFQIVHHPFDGDGVATTQRVPTRTREGRYFSPYRSASYDLR